MIFPPDLDTAVGELVPLVSVRKLCESFESVKGRGLSGSNYL